MLIPTNKGKDEEGVQAYPLQYHCPHLARASPNTSWQFPASPWSSPGSVPES